MRQLNDKGGSAALSVAHRLHGASVELDDVAHDRKTEPQAAIPPRPLVLEKAIEDVREEIGADALTGIADGEPRVRAGLLEPEVDTATTRRELDGVRQQVPHDLLEPPGIAG